MVRVQAEVHSCTKMDDFFPLWIMLSFLEKGSVPVGSILSFLAILYFLALEILC